MRNSDETDTDCGDGGAGGRDLTSAMSCDVADHACDDGDLDPDLYVRATSGFPMNARGRLFQSWRGGGWRVGANPMAAETCGLMFAVAAGDEHGVHSRSDVTGCSRPLSRGHQVIYWRRAE